MFWNKKKQDLNPVRRASKIVCPFCYHEYNPYDVAFMFKDPSGKPLYLSANPNSPETRRYAQEHNLSITVNTDDATGLPMDMSLKKGAQTISSSPMRVCMNENCRQKLSPNAGKYSSDNGIFVLGMKNSGKTVFITSVIKTLKDILASKYGCAMRAYNSGVNLNYQEYYKVMFNEKMLPAATVTGNSLVYEITNITTKRTMALTFSDIKGEISNSPDELHQGEMKQAIAHSDYFLLMLDLNEMKKDSSLLNINESIISDGLSQATQIDKEKAKKHLALVFTKSDELIGFDEAEVFKRESSYMSPIYKSVRHDPQGFADDRKEINKMLEDYLIKNGYATIVAAAKAAFYERNINYFAVSALGSSPVKGKIDEIAPIRVEEPIIWLLKKSGIIL